MAVSSVTESNNRAMQAERDADRKIAEAQKRSEDSLKKIDSETERLKDVYTRRSEDERSRHEIALQKQQMEGYENLKNIKQEKQRLIAKAKESGDNEVENIRETTTSTIEESERAAHQKQMASEATLQSRLKQTEETGLERIKLAKDSSDHAIQQIGHQKEERVAQLSGDAQSYYEKSKDNYQQASLDADVRFEKNIQDKMADHESQYNSLNKRAVDSIQQLKADTSEKLNAYSERNKDPFYRLVTTNAEFSENRDAYILTADIPPHEQKSVMVTIQGNQVVLSGNRKNQESLTLDAGHKQTTAAFQSFTETFPLSGPVDPKGVVREYTDGQLIVRIPKKTTYSAQPYNKTANATLPRVDRPQFPENLPNIQPGQNNKTLNKQT